MRKFVLALSYGNYLIQNGGTDKVIREHCEMFNNVGCDYMFVFPVVKNIKIGKRKKEIRCWGLNINERFIGIFTFENLVSELKKFEKDLCRAFFIHHTWRVDEDELIKLCNAFLSVPIYYYLHDFQSICANRNFVDETNTFCGYSLNEFKCNSSCIYYKNSQDNQKIFVSIINRLGKRITCIGPSNNTKDIFTGTFSSYKEHFIAIDHQKGLNYRKLMPVKKEKLKIAYIGAQASIKGWDDFKKILPVLDNVGYEMYYLGTGTDIPNRVKHIRVSVREQGNTAMQDALRKNEIDVVLLLSCWPETYSYTYYESYAAGCYILTYNSSGNIADQVKINRNGKVFNDYSDLRDYLNNPNSLKVEVKQYRDSKNTVPSVLVPNDEIVKCILEEKTENVIKSTKYPQVKNRAILYEVFYRFINHKL